MRCVVHVVATYAGDANEPADHNYKLTFVGILGQNGSLTHNSFYGAANEPEGTWPFILEPPRNGGLRGQLNWGITRGEPFDPGWEPQETDLFGKRVAEGEYFTLFADGGEEWTYQLKKVLNLT